MVIRSIERYDVIKLQEIWQKWYKQQLPFPDFFDHCLCAFVVVEDDQLIAGGGVKTIAEVITLTDKNFSARKRSSALAEILEASRFVAGKNGYHNLNAFVYDDKWREHLIKRVGFELSGILSLAI